MELKIDELKLEKSNMSIPEVLLLKVLHEHGCLSDILDALQKADFVNGYFEDNISFLGITHTGEMILDRLLEEQTEKEVASDKIKRLTEIAEKMKEIYPSGFKRDEYGNEVYPWRGSTAMIVKRLIKFEELFERELNIEDVAEATKRYVDIQTRKDPLLKKDMRLLKYFIYKKDEKQGLISDLLDYLETEVGEEIYDDSNGMTIL